MNPVIINAKLIFWDFDGVIKDSVEVKAEAYEKLFFSYGSKVVNLVRQHHQANGGVSRFEKIPLYLEWAGEDVTPTIVEKFCKRFSDLVRQSVIDSLWVPGVKEYLLDNSHNQSFVLVTATPESEIVQILKEIGIFDCFKEIHGAPKYKNDIIKDVLVRIKCLSTDALVIGDSSTDLKAAQVNLVPFLLRRTSANEVLQEQYIGPTFDNLKDE